MLLLLIKNKWNKKMIENTNEISELRHQSKVYVRK